MLDIEQRLRAIEAKLDMLDKDKRRKAEQEIIVLLSSLLSASYQQ